MANQTTFDLSQIQRALGIKTGVSLPSMESGELVQTMVVGDMSKSFAAEQFEARGFSTGIAVNNLLNQSYIQIIANAAGGIVIERVNIKGESALGAPIARCGIRVGFPTILTTPQPGNTFNVGGSPISSAVIGGHFPVLPVVARVDLDSLGTKTYENFSWFIASGSAFEITSHQLDTVMIANIQWREIPQAPGSQ